MLCATNSIENVFLARWVEPGMHLSSVKRQEMGMGYQFAAVGAAVYRKAKAVGAGREIPTEWLTQDVHP